MAKTSSRSKASKKSSKSAKKSAKKDDSEPSEPEKVGVGAKKDADDDDAGGGDAEPEAGSRRQRAADSRDARRLGAARPADQALHVVSGVAVLAFWAEMTRLPGH